VGNFRSIFRLKDVALGLYRVVTLATVLGVN